MVGLVWPVLCGGVMLCCVVLPHFDDGPAEKPDPEHVPEGTVGSSANPLPQPPPHSSCICYLEPVFISVLAGNDVQTQYFIYSTESLVWNQRERFSFLNPPNIMQAYFESKST